MRKYISLFVATLLISAIGTAQKKEKKPKVDAAPAPIELKLAEGFTKTASGLQYKILTAGTGLIMPMEGDKVKVHFIEMLMNGEVLEDTWKKNTPWDLKVTSGSAIPGFLEALRLMKVGDKMEIIVPSALAYGNQQAGPVPPNSNLKFIMELLETTEGVRPFFTLGKDTIKSETGLKYIHIEQGRGVAAAKGDIVIIKYSGYLPDGKIFDSSVERGETIKFNLGQSLPGLDEGIGYMKQGGKIRLVIPYSLGFGENGRGPIPPKTDVIYDIELLEVKPKIAAVPYDVKGKDTVKTASGLKYLVAVKGSGTQAGVGKKVKVHYSGYLSDGTLFDSSIERDMTYELTIGSTPVINGWQEVLPLMKVGDKWRVVIPPHLAYKEQGFPPKIPAGATLTFDMEMIEVQ